MAFQRGIRIITHPLEAIFPIKIAELFPFPEDQVFKGLSVENLFIHFMDDEPLREVAFPKGMRAFSRTTGNLNKERRFDAGIPFLKDGTRVGLNFHLSYDIEEKIINGYVDYYPTPGDTKINFIEIEYHITFSPSKD